MTGTILITLYGISNCDTVRKAKKCLTAQDIDFHFHDFRKDGLNPELVGAWLNQMSADKLINRRSATWKTLSKADQASLSASAVNDDANNANEIAIRIIIAQPTLIKRPVLVLSTGEPVIGFCETTYQQLGEA